MGNEPASHSLAAAAMGTPDLVVDTSGDKPIHSAADVT